MRKRTDWTAALGFAIFLLAFAGGPILNAIQSLTGIRIGSFILQILIAGLILLSAITSILRAMRTNSKDRPPNTAMPPFAGPGPVIFQPKMPETIQTPNQPSLPNQAPTPSYQQTPTYQQSPSFEPIIPWQTIIIGVLGLIILAIIGLFMMGVLPFNAP